MRTEKGKPPAHLGERRGLEAGVSRRPPVDLKATRLVG